jgi:hypothetical protein
MAMGAMAPDFLYFVPLPSGFSAKYGHEFPGVLTFSVPAALAMWVLWKLLLRDALIALLPTNEQQKLMGDNPLFAWRSLRGWLVTVLAVTIGVLSHVALDSFSHRNGWGVEHVSFLTTVAVRMSNRELALYKLVQYFGSIIGMAVLAIAYAFWSLRAKRDTSFRPAFAGWVRILLVLAIGALSMYVGYLRAFEDYGLASRVGSGIIGATSTAFVLMLAVGIWAKIQVALRSAKLVEAQLSR